MNRDTNGDAESFDDGCEMEWYECQASAPAE